MLLPVQTVGVMGDGRTYEYVCALRAVTSVDGMTADFYHYDMSFLGNTATRIINEVRASTVSSTTSHRSRPAPSSGSRPPPGAFGDRYRSAASMLPPSTVTTCAVVRSDVASATNDCATWSASTSFFRRLPAM